MKIDLRIELGLIKNINTERLEKALKEMYGKRCKEYDAMCLGCRIWRAYDELQWLIYELEDADKLEEEFDDKYRKKD